jgi:DNA-binding transcriptional LysR family regulator
VNWDDLRILLAVGGSGSFSQAARELGLDHSSVSRRMRAMERQLAVRLFERRADGLGLTAAGDELYRAAARMAEQAHAARRRVSGRDTLLRGTIRFATVDATARALMPSLQRFTSLYPEIELQLVLSQHLANLSRGEADVVLRATNRPPHTYIGRRLARHAFPVYAAPALLARFPPETSLDGFPWVCWGDGMTDRWMAEHVPAARVVCRASTALGMEESVRAGLGVAHLACFWADGDPDFVRIHPPDPTLALGLWLLIHRDLRRSARIRAFLDFLGSELAEKRDLIEGRRREATSRVRRVPRG